MNTTHAGVVFGMYGYLGDDSLHAPVAIYDLADREVHAHSDGRDGLVLSQVEGCHHEIPATEFMP